MAITNNGTVNSLPADQIPSGYTRPTVTTFTDWQYKRTLDISVDKGTVENATASTTMTNIITNGTVGLTQVITDLLEGDFLGTATVTAYSDFRALKTNYASLQADEPYLTNTAPAYICTVDIYVKAE